MSQPHDPEIQRYLHEHLAHAKNRGESIAPRLPEAARARWRELAQHIGDLQLRVSAGGPDLSEAVVEDVTQAVAEAALLLAETRRPTCPAARPLASTGRVCFSYPEAANENAASTEPRTAGGV